MYNLQNTIIQNTSLKTSYLLINNLNKINISLNFNSYKSTLASNVKYNNLRTLQPFTTQNGLFIKNRNLNNPAFIFKNFYSQTTESKNF